MFKYVLTKKRCFDFKTSLFPTKNCSEVFHLMPKFGAVPRRSKLNRYPHTNHSRGARRLPMTPTATESLILHRPP